MKPEHELFCRLVLKYNFNYTKAYQEVYPDSSYDAARVSASRLLTDANVRSYVNQLIEQRIEETGIEVADVVRKLWRQANADPNELIEVRRNCCRYCWGTGHLYQYTQAEWDGVMHRYEEDKYIAERDGKKPPRQPNPRGCVGFDRRLPPNPDCPECFGDGVEDIIVKDTRYLSPAARELYAGVKVTRDGIDIKTNNRDKALELLGRHLAMFTDNVDHKNNGGSFEPMTLGQFYQQEQGEDDQTDPES